ncbi:hypothetical protein AWN90_35760 [Nocardia terpenica]|uniref:Carrier domain-containing protein n=1 Tax=Nocardia terpenica TaxID=455432 RepID=A0A164N1T5_9NOCA|nr:hypothetical protein AWN90_35760 [Nocardia terpenica]
MNHGVHQRISLLAAEQPGATAVTDGTVTLCYRDLDRQANRLARLLRQRGAGPEVVVGVALPRTPRLIVAILAVLKAGAAYCPLDPSYPPERLRHILSDARPPLLITTDSIGRRLSLPDGTAVLDPDRDAAALAAQPDTDPEVAVHPDHLAYVVHTSGSTGAPKGVQIPHRGLNNLVDWHIRAYGITRSDRCAHVASFGFDASVWEIWPTLAAGAGLHLPDDAGRTRPDSLARWLAERRITVTFLPTPLAEEVLRVPDHRALQARLLLVGGDALTAAPPVGTPFGVVNHYGPTEATVVATAGPVSAGAAGLPSIGWPIDGVRAQLLDEKLLPVPVGTPGELYLAGPGLARGYLGRPGGTAERFVADPSGSGERLYRTGDIVRRRDDGAIDFVGRRDDQVSLRGVRIEPGEITARLRAHPEVADAAVIVRPAPNGHDHLAAYIVPASGKATPAGILDFLRQTLPAAMVPATLMSVPAFPLTAHGKLDRAALPDPAAAESALAEPPRDDLEALIAEVWYEVLGLADRAPNVHEDFLALGGHSLLATQLVARLRELLDTDLPAQVAMSAPTVAALAEAVRGGHPDPDRLATLVRLRRDVAGMSDDEVDRLLAELGGDAL